MIDFPLNDLLDVEACTVWLTQQLHPAGLRCPGCRSEQRRVARRRGHFLGYRCRNCDRYYTLLTETVFAKTRQTPAQLVLLLRGIAKGEPTARLAREMRRSRKQTHTLRQRVQRNLFDQQPREVLPGTVFEADELYQNAGEKKHPASGAGRSAASPRQPATWTRNLGP
jgi:transposase-like protein